MVLGEGLERRESEVGETIRSLPNLESLLGNPCTCITTNFGTTTTSGLSFHCDPQNIRSKEKSIQIKCARSDSPWARETWQAFTTSESGGLNYYTRFLQERLPSGNETFCVVLIRNTSHRCKRNINSEALSPKDTYNKCAILSHSEQANELSQQRREAVPIRLLEERA
jgi:hypothetical protein